MGCTHKSPTKDITVLIPLLHNRLDRLTEAWFHELGSRFETSLTGLGTSIRGSNEALVEAVEKLHLKDKVEELRDNISQSINIGTGNGAVPTRVR